MTPETRTDTAGMSELGASAVWLCENGFGIFPLHPQTKRPAMNDGLNGWFDDPESARELWSKEPRYNIGVTCGTTSHGLLVLDFDEDDEKGVHGLDTLNEWEDVHGELPATATAITGRGGLHYLYRTDRTNIHPSVNHELGVDVRSDGSYIVAPPSVHENGNRYRWMRGRAPWECGIAKANGAVYNLIDHVQRNGGTVDGAPQQATFAMPERIRTGERNDALFRYGCSLRHRGYPDDAIDAMMRRANAERCDEPMAEGELRSVIRQVCRYGAGHDGQGTMRGEDVGVGAPGKASAVAAGEVAPFRTEKGAIRANLLAQNVLRLNHARYIDGALAAWNGRRWAFDKRALEWLCLEYADDAKSDMRNEVIKYLEVRAPKVSSSSFDGGYYVQFSDVTWDVLNERAVDPTPDMLVTATLPVSWDVDAPYGDADRFIESVADGDAATMAAMCEVIGACMCCRRVLSQSPMLIGRPTNGTSTAANGKSTFIDVVRELLGDENVTSMDIAALGDKYGPAELTGKLANLGDDIPDGFLHGNELSLFKKLVTGNKIKAERKYHDPFDFKPSATMVFSMNAMPRLADTTDGVFRRLAFVPFRRTFTPDDPDFDPNILEKLTRPENLRRFAVLGVMALHDLLADGRDRLTEMPDMVAEIEDIRTDNSVVRRWMLDEGITEADVDHVPTQEVYERFRRWCESAGERYALSKIGFSRELLATVGNTSVSILRPEGQMKKVRMYVVDRRGNT